MALQVSVNAKLPRILPDMLVQDCFGSIGIVTRVTKKWVHVTMMIISPEDPDQFEYTNYHCEQRYKRSALMPVANGVSFVVKQKDSEIWTDQRDDYLVAQAGQ